MSINIVNHKTFGQGTVVSVEGKYITVRFSDTYGDKTFVYPDVFDGYLTYEDESLQKEISETINIKKEKRKQEEAAKEELRKKLAQKDAEEYKKLHGKTRSSLKKTVTKAEPKKKKTIDEILEEVIDG